MEHNDGYRRRELKATRIKRRLCASARLAAARRIAPWASIGVGTVLLFVIFLLSFDFRDRLPVILALVASWVLLVLLARLFLFGFARWVAAKAAPASLPKLVRDYIRMLLFDVYKSRKEALLAADESLSADAREYAEEYVLSPSEREAFLSGKAFEDTVVGIVERYQGYLEDLLSGQAEDCLAMRARLRAEMTPWREGHLPEYAQPQRVLIEDNLSLLLRQIADRRDVYRRARSPRLLSTLLDGVLLYPNPTKGKDAKKLRIPPKDAYERYCESVAVLSDYDGSGMEFSLDKEHRGQYREHLDACRAFRLTYTTVGCPEIDLDRYEERYRASLEDDERCWACKKKFHARYRSVCPRCKHYVCPKCGKCYCEKYIVRRRPPSVWE